MDVEVDKENVGGIDYIPKSEYTFAKEVWDERTSKAISQKNNWQKIAFVLGAVTFTSVCGAIYLGTLPKVSTQVVLIDQYNGRVMYGPVSQETGQKLPDHVWNEVKHEALIGMVSSWRLVSSDKKINDEHWDRTFVWLADGSKAAMDVTKWYVVNNPNERAKTELVSVKIDDDGPVSPNSWQVRWSETTFKDGQETVQHYWSIFTYRVDGLQRNLNKPRTNKNILADTYNGLNILITDFTEPRAVGPEKEL